MRSGVMNSGSESCFFMVSATDSSLRTLVRAGSMLAFEMTKMSLIVLRDGLLYATPEQCPAPQPQNVRPDFAVVPYGS
jgi:hypothetical protein